MGNPLSNLIAWKPLSWLVHCLGAGLLVSALYLSYQSNVRTAVDLEIANRARARQLRSYLQDGEVVRTECLELRKRLQELKTANEKEIETVDSTPRESEFLDSFTMIAKNAGLKIIEYRREGVRDLNRFSKLDLHIELEGNHQAMCQMLDQLERSSRVLRYRKLEIASDKEKTAQRVYLDLSLVFGFKDQAQGQKLAGKAL